MALEQATNQERTVNGLTKFVNLFNAAVAWINARLTARGSEAGDGLVLREKGSGANHVTVGPIGNTLAANRAFTLPDANVNVKTDILDRIDAIEGTGVGGALTDANIIVGNDSNVATARAMSGDATISNMGAVTIAAKAVTLAKMNDMATLSVIGRTTAETGAPEVLTAGTDHHVLRRSGAAVGFGLLVNDNVDAGAAIAGSKLAAATQAELARAAVAAEAAQSVTLRGDCTIQVNGFDGDPIDEPGLIRVWISGTDMGAPSATNNTVDIATGTQIQAVLANAHYLILTDATGAAEVQVTVEGAGDRYVMVEQGGRVVSQKLEIAVIGGE